jgi:hypothetical protein
VPGLVLVSVGDGTMFTAIFLVAAPLVPSQRQGVAGIGHRLDEVR